MGVLVVMIMMMVVIIVVVMMVMAVPMIVIVLMPVGVIMVMVAAQRPAVAGLDARLALSASANPAHQSTSSSFIRNSSPPVTCT
jgi:hypothetical protein